MNASLHEWVKENGKGQTHYRSVSLSSGKTQSGCFPFATGSQQRVLHLHVVVEVLFSNPNMSAIVGRYRTLLAAVATVVHTREGSLSCFVWKHDRLFMDEVCEFQR